MTVRRRARNSRNVTLPEVPLTPLIDTALTLLIIFMVTAPMMRHGLKIELPTTETNEVAQSTEEITVEIDHKQQCALNGTRVSSDQLAQKLTQLLEKNKTHTVFVHADHTVSYGGVMKVVDAIKKIPKVQFVALSTRPARSG